MASTSSEMFRILQLAPTGRKFDHKLSETVGLSFKSDHIARRDSTQLNSFVELSRCDQGFTVSTFSSCFHAIIAMWYYHRKLCLELLRSERRAAVLGTSRYRRTDMRRRRRRDRPRHHPGYQSTTSTTRRTKRQAVSKLTRGDVLL